MSEYVIGLAVIAVGTVVVFALCLLFLLVVYLKGGKEDLEAGANAIHKIRDVGLVSAVRAALESRAGRDAGRSDDR